MDGEKYVKLKHVEELLKLIEIRDSFHDWTSSYSEQNQKVEDAIDSLRHNAEDY